MNALPSLQLLPMWSCGPSTGSAFRPSWWGRASSSTPSIWSFSKGKAPIVPRSRQMAQMRLWSEMQWMNYQKELMEIRASCFSEEVSLFTRASKWCELTFICWKSLKVIKIYPAHLAFMFLSLSEITYRPEIEPHTNYHFKGFGSFTLLHGV